MANFAISTSDPYGEVISSLNYVLSNLGSTTGIDANVLVANVQTGEITSNSTVVSYLYQYMSVQYANSSTGGSGFSSNSYLKSYYGLRNTGNANPISFNPVDYVWYQVTGGFGTTKSLWYQTIGGRQIAFFAGNSAPESSFITVPDMPAANSTPLNLDTITSAQNNQIVNVNAYYQANVTPATPSGGTYNFTTFVLTPPSGWSANIPSFVTNTSVYVSTAAFVGNTNATAVPPATGWTVPAVYTSQFQGNTGPAGARGFLPMGFVITASDPTTYSNVDFTNAFQSSRTNSSPPIGLGFAPIQYDTAQFAYQNLFTGNTITTVQQYDGAGWLPVVGNVISGGLFVPGSINANTLNVNQVYALTIASTNANVGNVASNGFWLQSSTGDARFAGNTSIGANLNVQGLITVGTLNANTVGGGQIVPGSITGNLVAANTIFGNSIVANSFEANTINGGAITAGTINANAFVANTITATNSIQSNNATFNSPTSAGYWLNSTNGSARFGGSLNIGDNLTVGNNTVIGGNLTIFGLALQGTLVGNSVSTTNLITNAVSQQLTYQLSDGAQFVPPVANSSSISYWPDNTRGIAINGVITPLLSGGTGYNQSRITISYSVPIYSNVNPQYNTVELWKVNTAVNYTNVLSNTYVQGARKIRPLYTTTGTPTSDWYTVVGINGIFNSNVANIGTIQTPYTTDCYATLGVRSNTASNTVYRITSTTSPRFVAGDACYVGWSSNAVIRNVITVGSGGAIMTSLDSNIVNGTFESVSNNGTNGNNLNAVAANALPTSGTPVYCCAAGNNGTIVRSYRIYNTSGQLTNGPITWQVDGYGTGVNYATTKNLNGIASDGGRRWVAVGDGLTILYKNGTGLGDWREATWNINNSTFASTNLHDVVYDPVYGIWSAVGDNGLIVNSADNTGSVWGTSPAGVGGSATTRNLYSITKGLYSDQYAIAGDSFIYTLGPSGVRTNAYVGTASFSSYLQRLQYQGSWRDASNVSAPPTSQQINNQSISGTYVDYAYTAGGQYTYYVVVGNLNGNANVISTFATNPSLTISEIKR
jgi:hypothetical protein